MVTGPAAFENFKRLMQALLAVHKDEVVDPKSPPKRKRQKRNI